MDMTFQELSDLSSKTYSDIQKAMNDLIVPLATLSITVTATQQKSLLKKVGLRPSIIEDTYKNVCLVSSIINRYLAVIMGAINAVVMVQQITELDRDKYMDALSMDILAPVVEKELKQRLSLISFPVSKGVKGILLDKVKDIGTTTIVDLVMEIITE